MILSKIDNSADPCHDEYLFWCPGCKMGHTFITKWGTSELTQRRIKGMSSPPLWTFNGDMNKPTFSPSLLYRYTDTKGDVPKDMVCHLFLRDGIIEFLNDCTHGFAGRKVPLEDIDKVGE